MNLLVSAMICGGLVLDPDTWYDDTRLEFDFKLVEFRNAYLRENRASRSAYWRDFKGGIYECLVEGRPSTAEAGDLVLFITPGEQARRQRIVCSRFRG